MSCEVITGSNCMWKQYYCGKHTYKSMYVQLSAYSKGWRDYYKECYKAIWGKREKAQALIRLGFSYFL